MKRKFNTFYEKQNTGIYPKQQTTLITVRPSLNYLYEIADHRCSARMKLKENKLIKTDMHTDMVTT